MNMSSELGISPFLLQAISEKISAKDRHSLHSKMDPTFIKQEMIDNHNDCSQDEINSDGPDVNQLLPDIVNSVQQRMAMEGSQRTITADDIRQIISLKLAQQSQQAQQQISQSNDQNTFAVNAETSIATTDTSMMNFLSNVAATQVKTSASSSIRNESNNTELRNFGNEQILQSPTSSSQVFVCYNNQDSTVPSPSNDIVVSDAGSAVNVVIDQTGQRYLMQDSDSSSDQSKVGENLIRQARYNDKGELVISDMPVLNASDKNEGIDIAAALTIPATTIPSVVENPCPVCGDQVSGYHYGIFTCESCKGFFKRTVQNKKSFQCHRNQDCDVLRGNRKKCPACRFAKCINNGMKIEAVRLDRTRGGRSCYDGCSPHGRPSKTFLDKKIALPKPKKVQPDYLKQLQNMELKLPSGESISGSQLMNVLQKSTLKQTQVVTPVVPPVLTEIMNMESLLSEDESSSDFPIDKLGEGDQNFFLTFLQIAEVRLYKLVRWARNLPQFSAISTDDQILLLQNSWAELLIFNCCMRSIESRTEIFLPLGKTVDLEKARSISDGCEDIVQRMLDLTDQLRRLNVDQYEYVALKVLILITPDVKGMKESHRAREQQEIISDALYKYTASHYPQSPDKFGEMLLRLPEITRVSGIGKELLNTLMPPGFQSCGLLFELLKGDSGTKEES